MNPQSKAIAGHPEPARTKDLYRVAIVGAATLMGKEVNEVLNDRNFPALETKLLDDDESLGQLESTGDEISFIQSVRSEQFDKIDFTFFASDQESTRQNWKKVRDHGSAIVDMSAALENEPGAVVRSPWVERQLGQSLAPELQPGPSVTACPASVVLALLMLRLQKAGAVKNAVATVFQPASEHGQKGMDELHGQTVNLLSFQELPRKIFDAQVAFNMLARYGEQATPTLQSLEQRIVRHYQRIAGINVPVPSLLLVQAPIFHGYALAAHVTLADAADLERISLALAGDHVHVVQPAEESPSNVSVAGQAEIQVSLRPDAANPNSVWLWAAADNLRVAATTAVECAETMISSRPRGKIQ